MTEDELTDEAMTASALRGSLSDRLNAARFAGAYTRVDTRGGTPRAMLVPWAEYLRLCAAAEEAPRLPESSKAADA
ncbi:hypothetical protein RCO28_34485 [Streptomyces sp. LHD-70]|uniref:hypothetical protein n=1 Tax=Streptomyces sp. LHD-70 TaxID=3072140 RepID=UPI00280F0AC6|nr:hypothetical protein [Streptomyces sp. LHD-70]MDQ8707541.1 hypothetical protein [Streptomyces sp. LHD-70]